jgi:hypothetical protein
MIERLLGNERQNKTEESKDVRQVAIAFVVLRRLVEKAVNDTPLPDLPASGLVPAADLIDALMSGTANPVHRYLEEARGTKRQNKAPATRIAEMRQAVIVGALRSLQADTSPRLSRSSAARVIAAEIRPPDNKFTAAQIIGWDNRFSQKQDRFPDAFHGEILKQLGNRQRTEKAILDLAARYAYLLWTVPTESN